MQKQYDRFDRCTQMFHPIHSVITLHVRSDCNVERPSANLLLIDRIPNLAMKGQCCRPRGRRPFRPKANGYHRIQKNRRLISNTVSTLVQKRPLRMEMFEITLCVPENRTGTINVGPRETRSVIRERTAKSFAETSTTWTLTFTA